MEYIFSAILGIVQGLTEFLPVSSSGHLVLFHRIFSFEISDELAFDVALHLGTLLALIIFFHKDIIRYIKAFLNSFKNWNYKEDIDQRLAWLILVSIFPAGIIGYFLEDILENTFRQIYIVAIVLILVSFLFFLAEKYSKKNKDFETLTLSKSLIIGFAQVLALIPGVSRSGITIITGMGYGLKRELAARFSFLMSIPIIFVASSKKVYDVSQQQILGNEIILYGIGFIFSFVIGYFCIKYFLGFLKKHSLTVFAVYRIILGVIILAYYFLILN